MDRNKLDSVWRSLVDDSALPLRLHRTAVQDRNWVAIPVPGECPELAGGVPDAPERILLAGAGHLVAFEPGVGEYLDVRRVGDFAVGAGQIGVEYLLIASTGTFVALMTDADHHVVAGPIELVEEVLGESAAAAWTRFESWIEEFAGATGQYEPLLQASRHYEPLRYGRGGVAQSD